MSQAELAADYWGEWFKYGAPDEEILRGYLRQITDAADEASYSQDWRTIERLWDLLQFAEDWAVEEPFISVYESGLIHFLLLFAENHFIAGNWGEVLPDIQAALQIMDDANARRELVGGEKHGYSLARITCYGLLMSGRLENIDLSGFALTDEELIERTLQLADHIDRNFAKVLNANPLEVDKMQVFLATQELEACKLAYNNSPHLFDAAISRFNARHGEFLFREPFHFRTQNRELLNAWYWDFELHKAVNNENVTRADLLELDRMRSLTCRMAYSSKTVQCRRVLWNRQLSLALAKTA